MVDELFWALLLRPADEDSRDGYVRALRRGLPVETVVAAVATSVEATENGWRAPVAAALGPGLLAQADQRPVYAAVPPGYSLAAHEVVDRRFPPVGERIALGAFDLDQLYWTPDLVRRRAGLVTGPMGRAGGTLVAADALRAAVVVPPADPDADIQSRCLVGRSLEGRPWIDFDPAAEARSRGLDPTRPLQSLNQAGPDDLHGTDLAQAAAGALADFDVVLVLPGPPATEEGGGADWKLYRSALGGRDE